MANKRVHQEVKSVTYVLRESGPLLAFLLWMIVMSVVRNPDWEHEKWPTGARQCIQGKEMSSDRM
jgi:hypothetical protein